ncbi:hypothetical protein QMG83_05340 [Salinibacterium sp. G-O1]|uniref:hypothetical protein n=1 Tax=Salinibacterium sp. G-O1 TaxID=3046208 RepID=UPI0024BB1BE8|nr:hypothetical protein [Salinibacterium sp. G-O1]MDJ0334642.1 hypothetical protein [Salinibacterium sp. G-O1]
MPSEQDLRDLFASSDGPRNTIDPKRVIARSRGRRLPRQIVAGAAGALAIVGIATVAVQTSQFSSPAMMTSQGEADSGPSIEAGAPQESSDSAIKRAPAERLNLCEGSLAEAAPSFYGLQLDVAFPAEAPAGTDPVMGTVRLTNTSSTRVMGYSNATPALTLSQDGVVLWHSNGPMIMSLAIIDLEPGASMEYQSSFTPVRCEVADDLEASFRDELPAVPAGEYDLSAAIDFTADSSMIRPDTPELDLVGGPLSPITLR